MNGLLIFIGESFRLGNQGTRNRGSQESYPEQIKACKSHIQFIEHITNQFELNISVIVSTYNTPYNDDLLKVYSKYLIGSNLYDNVIGLNTLFHNSIKNVENYDFIQYIRIDLFLKPHFNTVFNPIWSTIRFPTICFIPYHKVDNDPRVNDTMLFIPKKYYKYIKNIKVYHDTWHELIKNTDLIYDDLDVMINTYHDSDSFKDLNPLYYIVNRPESTKWHCEFDIFDKELR